VIADAFRDTRPMCRSSSSATARLAGQGSMERVVERRGRLARPGDTVLLAPAAPPWTCSPTTATRDAFAAAVRRRTATEHERPTGRRDGTTATPSAAAPAGRRTARARAGTPPLRDALDRPLTSYYLLLGASALLLTIGLIMVLSASSVYSFEHTTATPTPSSSAAAVGGDRPPVRLVASGCRTRWSAARWLGIVVAVVLLALTRRSASTSTATRTGWRSARSDPAVRDRQARDRAVGRARLRQQGPPARHAAPDA
jgi:hypothetical protein